MKKSLLFVALIVSIVVQAQNVIYPHPVSYIHLNVEGQVIKMAYMDVKPPKSNGRSVLLLHGKNFNGFYWREVIPFLTGAGYRVIVPDQVGWGKSDKPNLHYSFHMLADNNAQLLDSLGISKINIVSHSMGGMLATRFAVMFPNRVDKLVLENPIGLEDYSTFVPYKSINELYKSEAGQTYESIKKYQQTYYPSWKEAYEPYVAAQAAQLKDTGFAQIAMVNAVTYQMIYEQPVVYSFDSIRAQTLLIIGQDDRTVVGKNNLTEQQKKVYGNYPLLGKRTKAQIKNSRLVELPGVGHIPHIQVLPVYQQYLLTFLKE